MTNDNINNGDFVKRETILNRTAKAASGTISHATSDSSLVARNEESKVKILHSSGKFSNLEKGNFYSPEVIASALSEIKVDVTATLKDFAEGKLNEANALKASAAENSLDNALGNFASKNKVPETGNKNGIKFH